ncbi:MAG: hypothetical protein AAF938_02035 [Myxococcota bacterium]
MNELIAWILIAALALGCGDDADPATDIGTDAPEGGVDASVACVEALFDPAGDDLFPNPAMMQPADTPTGVQLQVNESAFPSLARYEQLSEMVTTGLSSLDGFGTSAGAAFAFTAPVSPEAGPDVDPVVGGVGFLVLDDAGPRIEPAMVDLDDEGRSVVARPVRPLPAATWVAAFMTTAAAPCDTRASWLDELIGSAEGRTAEALAALANAGIPSDDLLALSVYPTQSLFTLDEAIADDIAATPLEDFAPVPGVCTANVGGSQLCVVRIAAKDYRDADGVLRDAEVGGEYELPLFVWLPAAGDAPWPLMFYGHGLSLGAPDSAPAFVGNASERGVAVAATSALEHPGHPTFEEGTGQAEILTNFFAIDVGARSVDALRLRDHFRQTVFDRLQALRVLRQAPDVLGDDVLRLDTSRFAYLGTSLGSLMGTALTSLTEFPAVALSLLGGRVSQLLTDEEGSFSLIVLSLVPRTLSDGEQRRVFMHLQTIVEAGDPINWAPRILDGRENPPAFLGIMAVEDAVVTNGATFDLMRAMELPVMPPVLRESPGTRTTAMPPLVGNRAGVTAALQHFDVIAPGRPADHDNTSTSRLAATSFYRLFETAWEGSPEILDPYAELGIAHE